jgi:glutamate dehydrogenase
VFERSAKSVTLSREAQALLELPQRRASPVEIIRAILCMRVDLLWNGGIGTYVKASNERHGEIGDRANDAVRVDGRQVRARVVGEGGNLGFSQRGRIEYAAAGGRINTDFIDNSAGVNTSDVEVNLKILLDAPGAKGRCTRVRAIACSPMPPMKWRAGIAQQLSAERSPEPDGTACGRGSGRASAAAALARAPRRDRSRGRIPADRRGAGTAPTQGRGLTRPELALLFAYGKIALNHALTETGSAADPYLARELERYFPQALQRRFPERIKRHRLRKQIIITATTNSIVNRVGPTLLIQCSEASNANAAAIARAYTIARDSADLRTLWSQIEALDGRIKPADQYDALLETSRYLTHFTLWLLATAARVRRGRRGGDAIAAGAARICPGDAGALEGLDRERYLARCRRYVGQGLPRAWLKAGRARAAARRPRPGGN